MIKPAPDNVSIRKDLPDDVDLVRSDFLDYLRRFKGGSAASIRHRFVYGFDSYERHFIAAAFIRFMEYRHVIDIGGLPGRVAGLNGSSRTGIITANISEPADVIYDGNHLPFDDNSFDGAVCLDVLEHVPSECRADFIGEFARVSAGPSLDHSSLSQ